MTALNLLVPVIISFALAVCLVPIVRRLAWRIGLVDRASDEGYKTHRGTVAYGGGAAIFVATLLPFVAAVTALSEDGVLQALATTWLISESSLLAIRDQLSLVELGRTQSLLTCAAFVLVLGLADDWRGLPALVRLAVQIAGATALAALFPELRLPLDAPPALETLAAVLWIVAMTNAFNFLDNMNGLTAGLSVLVFAGAALMAFVLGELSLFLLCALLGGSAAGFLLFNFPGASIFMGDAGGLFLGFLAGSVTLHLSGIVSAQSSALGFAPLLLLAVPAYDIVSVVSFRLAAGQAPWTGDTNHISHRLTRAGLSRRAAVLVIHAVGTATISLAFAIVLTPSHAPELLAGGASAVLLIAIFDVIVWRASRG